MDLTVASAFLPQVVVDFELSTQQFALAGWVVTMYLAAYAVSMTFAGRLSDLYGRRPAYLVCLVIFIAGSILVALTRTPGLSPSFSLEWLVISRVIQALGAGAMVPVSMALVGDLFPPERRATPLGIIAAVDTAGWVVGHLYGGIMIRLFTDWRLIFWLNVPIGVLAFALCWRALRDVPQQRHQGRLDLIGAVLIGLALAAFNIAVGSGAEAGTTSQFVEQTTPAYQGPLLIVAIIAFVGFIFRELRAEQPLLDLRLFKQKTFSGASLVNLVRGLRVDRGAGRGAVVHQRRRRVEHAQRHRRANPQRWGVVHRLGAVGADRDDGAHVGLYRADRQSVWLPRADVDRLADRGDRVLHHQPVGRSNTTYWQMVPGLLVAGLGFGMVLAPIATAVVNSAPAEERGVASALVIILRLVGMSLGGSIALSWGTQRVQTLTRRIRRRAEPVRRGHAGDLPPRDGAGRGRIVPVVCRGGLSHRPAAGAVDAPRASRAAPCRLDRPRLSGTCRAACHLRGSIWRYKQIST